MKAPDMAPTHRSVAEASAQHRGKEALSLALALLGDQQSRAGCLDGNMGGRYERSVEKVEHIGGRKSEDQQKKSLL